MSGERHDCAGRDVRGYPCSLGGKFHEEGRWRCHHHAPSKIAERRAKADKRYADKWKAIEANQQRAENKIWNDTLEAAAEKIRVDCIGMGRREIADAILRLRKDV